MIIDIRIIIGVTFVIEFSFPLECQTIEYQLQEIHI
jgi:hypothetical protein